MIRQLCFGLGFSALLVSCSETQITFERVKFDNIYMSSDKIEQKLVTDSVPWKYQIAAFNYAKKGDYKNALRLWDSAFKRKLKVVHQHDIDSIRSKYKLKNATKYISVESQKTDIVIINEAHHSSKHREFTRTLLKPLNNNGYRLLLLEALTNGDEKDIDLNTRGYPIKTTGFYTKDPTFSNLIREAINMGFTVLPYETTEKVNGKDREQHQAKNIQTILKAHPNEKLLIHCGYDHVLEGKHKRWEKAMAERHKDYVNIDPLTINQVVYDERSMANLDHIFLQALNPELSSVIIENETEMPYTMIS